MTVKEAARALSISPSKLYEMVERSEIGHCRIGGSIRFADSDLSDLMEETKKTRREPETTRKSKIPSSRPRLRFHR